MKTINAYMAHELKEQFPDAFEKAYRRYAESVDWIPWTDEIMDSLKAVFNHSGIRLLDWSIGAFEWSHVKFSLDEDIGELSGARALAWLENNLLAPLRIPWTGQGRNDARKWGYKPGTVKPCPFTGVCFDDDFLESLQEDLSIGMCIKDAYSNLADVASRLFENAYKRETSKETFLELDYLWYTEDGDVI